MMRTGRQLFFPAQKWVMWGVALLLLLCALLAVQAAAAPPPLLLAKTLAEDTEVTRYLISEKLDGVRAFWDGQAFRTRSGGTLEAPRWFVEKFPARPLDGELWAGRGRFERLSGIVRKEKPDDAEWREVRYMVFELPDAPGSFRERVRTMQRIVDEMAVPWVQVVEQFELGDRQELDRKLASVIRVGGEGLILHRADAPYATGRSDDFLKMKPLHDAEATVIGHLPGKGKYKGMLGALRVRAENGLEFNLGSGLSDALRRNPPPIGAIITYRYRNLTKRGIPRFASYYRVYEHHFDATQPEVSP
jgi:DNA ligase-1